MQLERIFKVMTLVHISGSSTEVAVLETEIVFLCATLHMYEFFGIRTKCLRAVVVEKRPADQKIDDRYYHRTSDTGRQSESISSFFQQFLWNWLLEKRDKVMENSCSIFLLTN